MDQAKHPFLIALEREGERLNRGRAEYTGAPKTFHHMGNEREISFPWLSDIEIAGEVRMLMRDNPMHEAIVCAGRDRILHLSGEVTRLQAQLKRANEIIGWMMPYIGTMCPPDGALYDLNIHCCENHVPMPGEETKGPPLKQAFRK